MNFKTFIQKLQTNFDFRKKVLLIGGISLVGILAVVFVVKDTNMSASVLRLVQRPIAIKTDSCTDSDGGINYGTKGTISIVSPGYTRTEQDTCNSNGTLREWFCGNPGDAAGLLRSENYVNCPNGCNDGTCSQAPAVNCNAPENILACSLGLPSCPAECTGAVNCNAPENILACNLGLSSCPPTCTGTVGYGYGYGYSRTGGTYGYGYGYGYKKIDPKTNKPWMYLLVPFKTYSKAIYDSVVSKFGFQMVKSYNKKEFKAPVTK